MRGGSAVVWARQQPGHPGRRDGARQPRGREPRRIPHPLDHDPERGRRDYAQSHIPGAIYTYLNEDLADPIIPGVTGRHPLPAIDVVVTGNWTVSTLWTLAGGGSRLPSSKTARYHSR